MQKKRFWIFMLNKIILTLSCTCVTIWVKPSYKMLFTNKIKQNFKYGIRPPVNHGFYNGTLVLFLIRPITIEEFNFFVWFMDYTLVKTTVAKYGRVQNKAQLKRLNDSKETPHIYWGGMNSTVGQKRETSMYQNAMLDVLEKCLDNEAWTSQINFTAIEWVKEFCTFISDTEKYSGKHFINLFYEYDCTEFTGQNLEDSEKYLERVFNLFKLRRSILLLCALRKENLIKFNSDQGMLKSKLPNIALSCMLIGKFVTTVMNDNSFKRHINNMGLSKRRASNYKAEFIDINIDFPFVHMKEIAWIKATVIDFTKEIRNIAT